MRAIVQRVSRAVVSVHGNTISSIDQGLLVYVGVGREDGSQDVEYLAEKIRYLRVFPDNVGKMNRDVVGMEGAVLLISAFTLLADARKGRRPSFDAAADHGQAMSLYESLRDRLVEMELRVETGAFGEYMMVDSVNDGPICILLESRRVF